MCFQVDICTKSSSKVKRGMWNFGQQAGWVEALFLESTFSSGEVAAPVFNSPAAHARREIAPRGLEGH